MIYKGTCLQQDGNARASANGCHVKVKHSKIDISVRSARAEQDVNIKNEIEQTIKAAAWLEVKDRAINFHSSYHCWQ